MTLTELINEVYTITNRADRVAETLSAVRRATLAAHQSDYFYKDIFETGLAFDSAEYIQDFDYTSLIPLFRSIKYLRKWDNIALVPINPPLQLVVPENIFDDYSCQKTDIYYAAGSQIHISSSTAQQYFLLGCYIHPDITTLNFNSWIAVQYPYAIVNAAAAHVFKMIGKDEEAARWDALNKIELDNLKASNIVAGGY